jgi:hypothetical protein
MIDALAGLQLSHTFSDNWEALGSREERLLASVEVIGKAETGGSMLCLLLIARGDFDAM